MKAQKLTTFLEHQGLKVENGSKVALTAVDDVVLNNPKILPEGANIQAGKLPDGSEVVVLQAKKVSYDAGHFSYTNITDDVIEQAQRRADKVRLVDAATSKKNQELHLNQNGSFVSIEAQQQALNFIDIKQIIPRSPIVIPPSARVVKQMKTGYNQVRFTWAENSFKYEARWHSRTPGAPKEQGNTWVVTRTTPGNETGQRKILHVMIGKDKWIPMKQWVDAITARQNGIATIEQQSILDGGHWPDN